MDRDQITKFAHSLYKEIEIEPEGLLWHYTNTRGLEGIVRDQTIRLSHPGFLNDPRELQHANSVYNEMLDQLTDGQDPLAQEFVRGYRDYKKDKSFPFNDHFVSSFCNGRDQLELWRQYGDDGRGFALGFRVKELRDIVEKQGVYIYRVLYKKKNSAISQIKYWISLLTTSGKSITLEKTAMLSSVRYILYCIHR